MATVLIAESDFQALKELRARLEAMGVNFFEAVDWPDTLKKAAVHRPDIVLVSEDLPQLSTLQMCQQLRGIGGMFKTPLLLILADQADELSPETMRRSRIDEAVSRHDLRTKLVDLLRRHLPTSGNSPGPEQTSESIELVRGLPITPDGTVASASGEIGPLSVATLFGQLASRWSTGFLALERERTVLRIYFQRGNIVDASTNLPTLGLAALLLQNRLVSESAIQQAEQRVRASQGQLSLERVLLAQSILDETRLRRVLLYQRQHAVLLPLSWPDGRFGFEPRVLEPERLEMGFNSAEILFTGLRSLRDVHRIEAGLPPPASTLKRTQHAFDGFQISKLSDLERNVLLLLDDGISVGSVLSRPRLDRAEAVRALCALYAGGVVEMVNSDTVPVGASAKSESQRPAEKPLQTPAPVREAEASAEPLAIEEGSLSGLPVAKLLAELYADARTGVLVLRNERESAEISLHAGRMIAARSNRPEDGWPQVMRRRGLLTAAGALRLERQIGAASVLAANLPLPADSVLRQLPLDWMRVVDVLRGVFGWKEGIYRFEEGPLSRPARSVDHTEALLLEGIRRLGPRAWTTTALPPATHFIVARPESFGLQLGTSEDSLLTALDGRLKVLDTVELSAALKFDVQPLLHGFLLLNLVRTSSKPTTVDSADTLQRRQQGLYRQIEEFMPLMDSENYFAILGIPTDASVEVLKASYKTLRERFHPEKAREVSLPDAMDPLSDIFGKIYLAYQSLSKPDVRQSHLEELERLGF